MRLPSRDRISGIIEVKRGIMKRSEALRMLGLGEDATPDEIKAAYRETAQILHPDRFASNKKLQERATEQFKNLQEAYDCLTGKSASSDTASSKSSRSSNAYDSIREAQLAGLAAARTQLIKQRDYASDERRNGAIMFLAGAALCLALRRIPAIAAIASAAAVWGVVQVISSQKTINTINENLDSIKKEKAAIENEMA